MPLNLLNWKYRHFKKITIKWHKLGNFNFCNSGQNWILGDRTSQTSIIDSKSWLTIDYDYDTIVFDALPQVDLIAVAYFTWKY